VAPKLISKINNYFYRFFQVFSLFVAILSFTSFFTSNIQVNAQSSAEETLALSKCIYNENTPAAQGGANLVECFKQVSTIAVVVGIILGGIMTARDVLTSYIPGQEINTGTAMRDRITGLITGIILISMPGAILNLFNPATTNIDFLSRLGNLPRPANTNTKAPAPTTPTNQSNNNANTGNTVTSTNPVNNSPVTQNVNAISIISQTGNNLCKNITVLTSANVPKSFLACDDKNNANTYWENYKCLGLVSPANRTNYNLKLGVACVVTDPKTPK